MLSTFVTLFIALEGMNNIGTFALPLPSAPAMAPALFTGLPTLTEGVPSAKISAPDTDGEYKIFPMPGLRGPMPRDINLDSLVAEQDAHMANKAEAEEQLCAYIHSLGHKNCELRMLPTDEYPEGRVLNDDLLGRSEFRVSLAKLHNATSHLSGLPTHKDKYERDVNRHLLPGGEMRPTVLEILNDGYVLSDDPTDIDQDGEDIDEPLLPRAELHHSYLANPLNGNISPSDLSVTAHNEHKRDIEHAPRPWTKLRDHVVDFFHRFVRPGRVQPAINKEARGDTDLVQQGATGNRTVVLGVIPVVSSVEGGKAEESEVAIIVG